MQPLPSSQLPTAPPQHPDPASVPGATPYSPAPTPSIHGSPAVPQPGSQLPDPAPCSFPAVPQSSFSTYILSLFPSQSGSQHLWLPCCSPTWFPAPHISPGSQHLQPLPSSSLPAAPPQHPNMALAPSQTPQPNSQLLDLVPGSCSLPWLPLQSLSSARLPLAPASLPTYFSASP